MSINKVIYGDQTLIDLTSDNIKSSALLSGFTAHDSSGAIITGTIIARTASDVGVAGPTVSVPSGAYSAAVSTTIAIGSVTVNSPTITQNPAISLNSNTGIISASNNGSTGIGATVTAGYVTSAKSGTAYIRGSSTYALPTIPAATITPTESSQVAAASGKFTLGNITVAAISSDYIGSNIPQRYSSDLIASGSYINVLAGYYAANASKAIAYGSYKSNYSISVTPGIIINTNNGLIQSSVNVTSNDVPVDSAGYFDNAKTLKTVVAGSSSKQLDIQAATTISPTESEQTAVAKGKYTTGIVKVGAISSNYVGSNITTRSSSDLTISGATVTAPAGYYSAAAATTIPNGSAKTPATTITSTPGITISAAGLITATNNKTQNVTPSVTAGYVSSGTAGTITVSGSNTSQLSTQAAATISPTESVQTAVASGKYTTGIIKVGAISSNYVGSNIPQRTSSNLSASGSYIIVPSGYYAAQASKPVSGGSAKTPATTITAQPAISISASGLITATNSKTQNVTPTVTAGYVSSGTAGTITVNGSNTSQLTTKAAATYTPGTSDQTISANQYLTGAQTVKGDSNLIAANIASGVTIFGITGTHQGGITPTGTITISSNGTYDVTNYASASVKVGATVSGTKLIVPEGMIGV